MNNNNNIEQLSKDLVELTGNFIFPEYYSHTDKVMWKILNPFTKYAEEKIVLVPVDIEDGVQRALTVALVLMTKKRDEWYEYNELKK